MSFTDPARLGNSGRGCGHQKRPYQIGKDHDAIEPADRYIRSELSAAFLCADLGVAHEPFENTAAYIENWLAVLKADKRAIITAASKAQAVADYLHKIASG